MNHDKAESNSVGPLNIASGQHHASSHLGQKNGLESAGIIKGGVSSAYSAVLIHITSRESPEILRMVPVSYHHNQLYLLALMSVFHSGLAHPSHQCKLKAKMSHRRRKPEKNISLPLVLLALAESVGVLLQGAADQLGLLPQVRRQEAVGVGDGSEGSLQGVLEGLGRAGRRGVGILNTSELEETLDGGRGDDLGTTGGGDELESCVLAMVSLLVSGRGDTYADGDGTALAALLDGQGVGQTKVGTPVTAADGDDAQLGDDDGGTDGGGNLLRGLDTETDVALGVTNDDDGLETGTLTGTGLLLDGLDL